MGRRFSMDIGILPNEIENPAYQRDTTPMTHKVGGPCIPVARVGMASWHDYPNLRELMPPPFCPVCMGSDAP